MHVCIGVCLQATVPAAEAYAQLNAFSDQPLLFVDHPVMLTHNATDGSVDAVVKLLRERVKKGGRLDAIRDPSHAAYPQITPEHELIQINHHLKRGHCKANWVSGYAGWHTRTQNSGREHS